MMRSLKDKFLAFAFSHIYFLVRPYKRKTTNFLFTLLHCCIQLWCLFWCILTLASSSTDTIFGKYKLLWGRGFVTIGVGNCVLNVFITIHLSFGSKVEDYAAIKLHSKRKLFLEAIIFAWIFLDVYKLCHLSYQYYKYHETIFSFLEGYSYDYLLFRLEITVLYLGLRIERLVLRFDALISEMGLWLPLEEVVKINRRHHTLINEIQEISRITGPIFFLFCLRCVGAILTNFYSLFFIQSNEQLIKLMFWYNIKQITTYFVRWFKYEVSFQYKALFLG